MKRDEESLDRLRQELLSLRMPELLRRASETNEVDSDALDEAADGIHPKELVVELMVRRIHLSASLRPDFRRRLLFRLRQLLFHPPPRQLSREAKQ